MKKFIKELKEMVKEDTKMMNHDLKDSDDELIYRGWVEALGFVIERLEKEFV